MSSADHTATLPRAPSNAASAPAFVLAWRRGSLPQHANIVLPEFDSPESAAWAACTLLNLI